MSYKVEALLNSDGELGEGPHWDVETQSLYFVDIHEARLLRYDFNENKTYETKIENEKYASFIIPIEGKPNHFAVGLTRRVANIKWDGKSAKCKIVEIIYEIEPEEKFMFNRINDGKADPAGRLFTGTMHTPDLEENSPRTGNFYCLEKGKKPILIKEQIGISNGLAWNLTIGKMYYIDSFDLEIKEYDYDVETGEVKLSKIVYDFRAKEPKGYFPDGMTIDTEGNLFVAVWGSYKVFKINPRTGKKELEIEFPSEKITSAAFGGPNLDVLFVTSAAFGGKRVPNGQTYKVTGLGSKGFSMTNIKW